MRKRDRFRLLLFPVVPFLFAVGWVLNVFGDRQPVRRRIQRAPEVLVFQALNRKEDF